MKNKEKCAQGIQFPIHPEIHKISTSQTGKEIMSAALAPFDTPDSTAVLHEKKWRKHYPAYFKTLVREGIKSPQKTLKSAEQGLQTALDTFLFHRGGQWQSLSDAMTSIQQIPFSRFTMKGEGEKNIAPWGVPYQGEFLQGDKLIKKLDDWVVRGIVDITHADALKEVMIHPEWFDLSARTVVLFGAGSEAGPLTWLSKWKANIIAIDLPTPAIWEKIEQIIKAGNATLIAPMQQGEQNERVLGADLLAQTPEIANWLTSFSQQLDLAGIAYLDGEKHVRVSMAMIAIMRKISQEKNDSTLMFMLTPTDIYAIPARVIDTITLRAKNRQNIEKVLSKLAYRFSLRRFFQPNDEMKYPSEADVEFAIADCMVVEQGPNYALAKRLQQWYAMLARDQGQHVSINIAPSTTTRSVVKNPILKAAFDGASLFGVDAFEPETTNAIMAALWIYDLNSEKSLSHPQQPLAHPFSLIMQSANHGGLWNVPYLVRTALPLAAIWGWTKQKVKLN